MPRRRRLIISGSATLVLCAAMLPALRAGAAGLAAGREQRSRPPQAMPVWPEPPAPARIRFVRTLVPATARGRGSAFGRLWNVITGGRDAPVIEQPYGVCVAAGRLFVADTVAGRLHQFDLDRTGYRAIDVRAESLIGIASIGDRLFVTDSAGPAVIALDLKGKELWRRGAAHGFARPTGIAATPEGALLVVDTLRNRVVPVTADGQVGESFGSQGTAPGQFNYPTNITVDARGTVYVTDTMNFRVQMLDARGRSLGSFGRLGDGSGDFNKPKGIALDSEGHIYVVEGLHDVVQIFDARGTYLLGFGESGAGNGQLWLPSGLTIWRDRIFVSDSANRRVQEFVYVKGGA